MILPLLLSNFPLSSLLFLATVSLATSTGSRFLSHGSWSLTIATPLLVNVTIAVSPRSNVLPHGSWSLSLLLCHPGPILFLTAHGQRNLYKSTQLPFSLFLYCCLLFSIFFLTSPQKVRYGYAKEGQDIRKMCHSSHFVTRLISVF